MTDASDHPTPRRRDPLTAPGLLLAAAGLLLMGGGWWLTRAAWAAFSAMPADMRDAAGPLAGELGGGLLVLAGLPAAVAGLACLAVAWRRRRRATDA
ncbi:hypothetical protein [Bifidobacterium myosotis]|uniref:Uncharacterized protein n=1 Tax=Bifidobacterium myosotis TaxID=1630166 RepID=A0A5M9ZJ21_9BIFI|nr:hypothetical protein [Bifidobacterium myosotis]KAA8826922.1 hypothetical protein EMO91_10340 [Bifidobacterium myosotis]